MYLPNDAGRFMNEDQHEACDCFLCLDGVPDQIIERVKASAASQGAAMTREEFLAWLDALEPAARP